MYGQGDDVWEEKLKRCARGATMRERGNDAWEGQRYTGGANHASPTIKQRHAGGICGR